jgi:hypothetical protein
MARERATLPHWPGFLREQERLPAQCLQASRLVRGKSAQHVAGEADFQSGAKNIGGWAGPWIPLEVVEVEQQARVKRTPAPVWRRFWLKLAAERLKKTSRRTRV